MVCKLARHSGYIGGHMTIIIVLHEVSRLLVGKSFLKVKVFVVFLMLRGIASVRAVERISGLKLRCRIGTSSQDMAVQEIISSKLTKEFEPVHLDVINESYMHNVPKGSETHFKVVIVSDQFEGKSLIQRHRSVNELLKDELAGSVHALSIQAKTSQQWEATGHSVHKSPPCLGGSGK